MLFCNFVNDVRGYCLFQVAISKFGLSLGPTALFTNKAKRVFLITLCYVVLSFMT